MKYIVGWKVALEFRNPPPPTLTCLAVVVVIEQIHLTSKSVIHKRVSATAINQCYAFPPPQLLPTQKK
jgi:hypothetical protein